MHAIDNLSPLYYHVGSTPPLNNFKAYKSILSLKTFSRIRNRLNRPVLTISSSQASFTSLSNELIAQIFEFGHVSDHLSLAMTCRRLSQGGQPTLIRHQKDFQEYNVVSDFLPLIIPLVLQKVVRDQYVARDIRSIEIWGDRLT
ncbi:hypothetical protein FOC1_g10006045 [Fusarium oxysporum f. sp. cubense race 1]|uniref:Uncharacterized protein n=1 Tax=Fusarium oxysporum f. sp. cubense (strain race 1) TaxID=1229664 RepID=N4U196_FUSC1|nr:hypothetical protein FOC1_g10006045 [Fusarium oxysporum f. sp. cubense race 1]